MTTKSKSTKTRVISVFLTVSIIGLLILTGPAQAFTLGVTANQAQVSIGEEISFTASINIASGERLPVDYLELDIGNQITCRFKSNGDSISGCSDLSIIKINDPSFTEGNRYGNFSGMEYHFGYGYGFGDNMPQILSYNITLNSNVLGEGTFTTKLKVLMLENPTIFESFGDNITVIGQPPIKINEFVSNPNSGPEWIELFNAGTEEIDLTGWTIEDGTGSTFGSGSGDTLLEGLSIPAQGFLVLEKGIDFSFALNNGGDIIILKRNAGEVDRVTYGNFNDDDISDNAPAPGSGESTGRITDGQDNDVDNVDFQIFVTPTQGSTNNPEEPFQDLTIFSPVQNAIYDTRIISLDVLYGENARDFRYSDNGHGFKILCRECNAYNQTKQFTEGFHELMFRAINDNGEETFEAISFLVDIRNPDIRSTFPVRGFTSGLFKVEFREMNPVNLFINYGTDDDMRNSEVDLDSCDGDGQNTRCDVEINLADFDGEEITYWFNLTDILENSDESRVERLTVDATLPVVNSFNYELVGRRLGVLIDITEENFNAIRYKDNEDRVPRYRTLCSRLENGVCDEGKFFARGNHQIDIKVLDKARNEAIVVEGLEFTV